MSELMVWLNDILAERERVALAEQHQESGVTELETCPGARSEPVGDLPAGEEHCWCGLAERRAAALALVEAHRVLLAIHTPNSFGYCTVCGWDDGYESTPHEAWPCPTVRALASAYRHAPGWQSDWGPT